MLIPDATRDAVQLEARQFYQRWERLRVRCILLDHGPEWILALYRSE